MKFRTNFLDFPKFRSKWRFQSLLNPLAYCLKKYFDCVGVRHRRFLFAAVVAGVPVGEGRRGEEDGLRYGAGEATASLSPETRRAPRRLLLPDVRDGATAEDPPEGAHLVSLIEQLEKVSDLISILSTSGQDPDRKWWKSLAIHTAWQIWKDRNRDYFDGGTEPVERVAFIAHSEAMVYTNAYSNRLNVLQGFDNAWLRNLHRWSPPEEGTLKLNFDGSYIRELNLGGAGFLLRNSRGKVLCAGWSSFPCFSPLDAEQRALWEGLRALGDTYLHLPLQTEGDSAMLIARLILGGNLDPILQDCAALMARFQTYSITHTPRDGNVVADQLARRGLLLGSPHFSLSTPSCIEDHVRRDAADIGF